MKNTAKNNLIPIKLGELMGQIISAKGLLAVGVVLSLILLLSNLRTTNIQDLKYSYKGKDYALSFIMKKISKSKYFSSVEQGATDGKTYIVYVLRSKPFQLAGGENARSVSSLTFYSTGDGYVVPKVYSFSGTSEFGNLDIHDQFDDPKQVKIVFDEWVRINLGN
jgi:hypothetical protein